MSKIKFNAWEKQQQFLRENSWAQIIIPGMMLYLQKKDISFFGWICLWFKHIRFCGGDGK